MTFDINVPLLSSLLVSILCAFLLQFIYRFIKNEWPEAYTSVKSTLDNHVRTSPFRSLVVFRATPVAIVTLFATTFVDRIGGPTTICFLVYLGLYLSITDFSSIINLWNRPAQSNRILFSVYHINGLITVIISASTVYHFRKHFAILVPETKELVTSVWSGFFAAILIFMFRSIMTAKKLEGKKLVNELIEDIGAETWNEIPSLCNKDPQLSNIVSAIALAECQQRPKWFRRLERIFGRFTRSASYGVCQTKSDRPISDLESIKLTISAIYKLGYSPSTKLFYHSPELRHYFSSHNPDSGQISRMLKFYDLVKHYHSHPE